MKLYPKRLRNMKSLKQEKKALLKEKRELDKEDFFSLKGMMVGGSGDGEHGGNGGGIAGGLLNLFQGSSPIAGIVGDVVKSGLGKAKKNSGKTTEKKRSDGRSLLASALREFVGGYLKWKAIELSYKGIKLIIKKQRSKRAEE